MLFAPSFNYFNFCALLPFLQYTDGDNLKLANVFFNFSISSDGPF